MPPRPRRPPQRTETLAPRPQMFQPSTLIDRSSHCVHSVVQSAHEHRMVKIRVVIDGNRDPLHMKVPLNATVRNLKTRVHNVLSPPEEGPASTLFLTVAANFKPFPFALRVFFSSSTTTYPVLSARVIAALVLTYCFARTGARLTSSFAPTLFSATAPCSRTPAPSLTYLGISDGEKGAP